VDYFAYFLYVTNPANGSHTKEAIYLSIVWSDKNQVST